MVASSLLYHLLCYYYLNTSTTGTSYFYYINLLLLVLQVPVAIGELSSINKTPAAGATAASVYTVAKSHNGLTTIKSSRLRTARPLDPLIPSS